MAIRGTQIKKFFECYKEREYRKNNRELKGIKWGKICEAIYIEIPITPNEGSIYKIVQKHINKNFPTLSIPLAAQIISGLTKILYKIKLSKEQKFFKTHYYVKNEKFSVEIDTLIREESEQGFIREIKSYPGPNKFAWNSDIMQLTTQNIVLSSEYEIDFYYGEIAYIGNGKIININTKPYEKAVFFAYNKILNGHKMITCSHCSLLDIPCYCQVRYNQVYKDKKTTEKLAL